MADKIRTLGPGSLVIGTADDQYKLDVDCTSVELSPDNSSEDPDTYLDGHEEGGALTTSWKLSGSIAEDYSMNGAQVYCLNHAGETKTGQVRPEHGRRAPAGHERGDCAHRVRRRREDEEQEGF